MIKQTPGIIYLNQDRIHHENAAFRALKSLEAASDRIPPHWQSILVFEENTLAAQSERAWYVAEDSEYYWIPLVGTIEITDANANVHYLEPGSMFKQEVKKGASLCVFNPYEDDSLVQYLQVVVAIEEIETNAIPQTVNVAINDRMDELVKLTSEQAALQVSIGKFSGRSEALVPISSSSKGVFCFVIQGAFELQYRLLEKGDGLALWNLEELDLEALSENAIILLLEVKK
ncbi:MAG: hypothetical protein K2P88_09450 [Chitinophagaceae bacterium]|nr:hypothetical protein [Chitinophagaceae bacterium]